MAVQHLREAFNDAAAGVFTASIATLGYERSHDTEWQRLTFSGTAADGSPFATQSDLLRPGTNVMQAARDVALALIAKGKPKS